MLKTYPALFHDNGDGSYTITYPDLIGCVTEGYDIDEAMYMAREALRSWLEFQTDEGETIDPPSDLRAVKHGKDEFVTLISADVKEDVKRTLKVPRKLYYLAQQRHLDLSLVLQRALERELA